MSRTFGKQHLVALSTSFIAIFLLSSLVMLVWDDGSAVQGGGQATLTGSENHAISLTDAIDLTRNYRNGAIPGSTLAEAFGKNAIQDLLNQADCVGLKVYFGRRTDGVQVLVMVGVSSTGMDLVNGSLVETGWPCPPICDSTSPLAQ